MSTTLINNNYPKISNQQQNHQCKVRFQSSNIINDFASQNLPKMDIIPSTGWKRFSSLKLHNKRNKQQNQQQNRPLAAMSAIALRQQQSVRRLLTTTEEEDEEEDEDDDDEEEEETSSNSMPLNNTTTNACGDGRRREILQGDTKKMSSFEYNNTSRSENNAKTVASAYMAMKQSNNYSKSSSTPHGLINLENKRRRKSKESMIGSVDSYNSKLCFFGILRIETAARLFLFFYVALSACGVIFGSVATMVWILVPLVVVPLAAYSLSRHSSKCLYPFLVISVINSIVTFCMALIVGGFSLLCFEQLKKHFETIASQPSLKHFSTSLQSSDSFIPFFDNSNSSSMTTFIYCTLTILSSLILSLFFFWQSIVLFSCITYFDVLAQQRKQHEQQLKQSVAAGIESRIHSLASAPTEIRGTQSAVIGGKMECSQCISEIRQLDQFSELKASFRQC